MNLGLTRLKLAEIGLKSWIVEMKGCLIAVWKPAMMISEHQRIVNVKCAIIDYRLHNVLRFLDSLNLCNLTAVLLCSTILRSIFVCVIIRQL